MILLVRDATAQPDEGMARPSEESVIRFSMSRFPPFPAMSGNPPSESRLVARAPKDGTLVHNPMLALAVCIGLLFSALVGTAFIRYALARRRQKKGEPMERGCDVVCGTDDGEQRLESKKSRIIGKSRGRREERLRSPTCNLRTRFGVGDH